MLISNYVYIYIYDNYNLYSKNFPIYAICKYPVRGWKTREIALYFCNIYIAKL